MVVSISMGEGEMSLIIAAVGRLMLTSWLVQMAAGVVVFVLYQYDRWTMRRSNRRARIRLDEGFGSLSERQ